MKFSISWLHEYLETTASLEEIVTRLTALGLEVEQVTDKSVELAAFKVAKILSAAKHPDAEKLQVCKVDTGKEVLQIVCGAPNARAGINVVLAPIGSVIPTNDLKIKASKIRGVESFGMLCSAAELGLGKDHSGIIEMPANDADLGKQFVEVFGLNDPVLEIAITPNRGDCLGVFGIARDLAAAGLGRLKPVEVTKVVGGFKSPVNVTIKDEKLCPMFVGRYFKGVKNGPSPEWLKRRLESIGLNPISALVDITNYIAYAFGRPLHVYDAKKLHGDLVVRAAKKGEKIKALNANEYELHDDMPVIADSKHVQALGGVIGGELSGCDDDTTDVFLEVALFDPIAVAKTGRTFDIITDSRYRFERNVDPGFVMEGAEIASQMIIDLCGGSASGLVVAGKEPDWHREIHFDCAEVAKIGGVNLHVNEIKRIFSALGLPLNGNVVKIPSWRSDIEGTADLVEEVLRIYGYDNIPKISMPTLGTHLKPILSPKQKNVSLVRRNLALRGLNEVVTWSFMCHKKAKLFGADSDELKLLNPISSDLDMMRPSIIPNLLDVVVKNIDRGFTDIGFFEIGLCYKSYEPDGQYPVIAGIRAGNKIIKSSFKSDRVVDLFDAKADAIAALKILGSPVDNLKAEYDAPSWYHPGRSGALKLGKEVHAYFGEIHPLIAKAFDIGVPVTFFEVFVDSIPQKADKKATSKKKFDVSNFQSSVRDFAFVINQDFASGDIIRIIKSVDKNLIDEVKIFDVYQGKGVADGSKSVAVTVKIQPRDRTLTDQELENLSKKIITEVVRKTGGELR